MSSPPPNTTMPTSTPTSSPHFVVRVEGDGGVPNDDISVRRWDLEEELVGEGEGEAGAVESEEGRGDEGVTKEGGLGGMGVERGGEEGEVEGGAGLEGEGEEESMESSRARRRLEYTKKLKVYERMEF